MSLCSAKVCITTQLHVVNALMREYEVLHQDLNILGQRACLLRLQNVTWHPFWPSLRLCAWLLITAYGSKEGAQEGMQCFEEYIRRYNEQRANSGRGVFYPGPLGCAAEVVIGE